MKNGYFLVVVPCTVVVVLLKSLSAAFVLCTLVKVILSASGKMDAHCTSNSEGLAELCILHALVFLVRKTAHPLSL